MLDATMEQCPRDGPSRGQRQEAREFSSGRGRGRTPASLVTSLRPRSLCPLDEGTAPSGVGDGRDRVGEVVVLDDREEECRKEPMFRVARPPQRPESSELGCTSSST